MERKYPFKKYNMKMIYDDASFEEDVDGSIKFIFEGYVYQIGSIDSSPGWFSRQTIDDYENGRDNHEAPTSWSPENIAAFKLLRNIYE